MFSKKRKMTLKKAVCVPQVESQISQRDEERQTDRAESSSQIPSDKPKRKRGNYTEKDRFLLKVKLPKRPKWTLSRNGKEEKTPTKNNTEPSVSREKQCAGSTQSDCAEDIFFFSEGPSNNAVNEKEMARLTVLRTISKMLEENQLIRQRVATLSQTNRGCTD